eukprot:CAMPEP_0171081598 /NCGR_PEP_ID=MMETSP0766_2-20121228/16598_1 /TAXON_ID=439317 /ORGANISM="Gambierdiscus australes, Strain CAWD 149" /LENGTH=46 /DNA_ID= /DNA_START= /DNA_END= /DNA_ORIENTATION=
MTHDGRTESQSSLRPQLRGVQSKLHEVVAQHQRVSENEGTQCHKIM